MTMNNALQFSSIYVRRAVEVRESGRAGPKQAYQNYFSLLNDFIVSSKSRNMQLQLCEHKKKKAAYRVLQ